MRDGTTRITARPLPEIEAGQAPPDLLPIADDVPTESTSCQDLLSEQAAGQVRMPGPLTSGAALIDDAALRADARGAGRWGPARELCAGAAIVPALGHPLGALSGVPIYATL